MSIYFVIWIVFDLGFFDYLFINCFFAVFFGLWAAKHIEKIQQRSLEWITTKAELQRVSWLAATEFSLKENLMKL